LSFQVSQHILDSQGEGPLRIASFIATILVLLASGLFPAEADTRVALVVGNTEYKNVTSLPNPANDANDVSKSLQRLGFDVRLLVNANFEEFRRALIDFSQQAADADFSVIYFAGHGMQIDGENWLIPVDATLTTDLSVANEAIGLQSVTRAVSNSKKLGMVILDACRTNPFIARMRMTHASRDVNRGFSRVEPPGNVLIAYAARDGTVAADGSGRNSPFTSSLLKNMETPGLEVRFLFANVHDDVLAATHNTQEPFVYSSLSKNMIYLREASAGATPGPTASQSPAPPPCGQYTAHVESKSVVHTTPTVTVNVSYLDAQPGCSITNVDAKVVKQSNFSNLKISYEDNRKKARVTYNLADRPTPGFASIDFVVMQTSAQ
jgi:Caspase domain